jgi:subtilisin family serine protease
MKKSVAQSCLLVLTSSAIAMSIATNSPAAQPTDVAALRAERQALQTKEINRANARDEQARQRGIPLHAKSIRDEHITLSGFVNGRPIYDAPVSMVNGVSLNVNRVHLEYPEPSFSNQFVVGVWDEAGVKANHLELTGRVGNIDSIFGWIGNHSTAVAGIIAATGVDPAVRGMVPSAIIHAYDMRDDLIEMTSRAAEVPLDLSTQKNILVSNHSYGEYVGWGKASMEVDPGVTWSGWYWFGEADEREDRRFGQYSERARDWDTLVHAAPYYLPVRAAGNDRTEGGLGAGTSFRYWDSQTSKWVLKSFDPATDPLPDNQKDGGYDTIGTFATAKNILTVGAVTAAVSSDTRLAESGRMTSFSSWGPTDDGRIKPDLVAVGADVMTLYASSGYDYSSGSGTSFSAPAVTGAAALLQQIHTIASGEPMLASTVKALLIHTASDMGPEGPDYTFGWGLVDALAAADLLNAHLDGGQQNIIQSHTLAEGGTHVIRFQWDGSSPIRATLAWTDPAGTAKTGLNDRTPVLVNDLDLRVTGPDGTVHLPFALDPANPGALAVTADNLVDNVEQILIGQPVAGEYTLSISHKGNLLPPDVKGKKQPGTQTFSLVVTGQAQSTINVATDVNEALYTLGADGPVFTWTITNPSNAQLGWSVKDAPQWLSFSQQSGTLSANQSIEVLASVNATAPNFGPGYHTGEVVFASSDSVVDQVSRVALDTWRPAAPDFVETFETGELQDTWRVTGIGQPRAAVTQELGPIDSYHLVLDDYMTGGARSRIEVTTLLDVAGWEDLFLSFDAKSFHAPTIGPHANPYLGGSNTTGVAISADGELWYEIEALRGSNIARTYTIRTMDLDAALESTGLLGNGKVFLRFSTFVRNPADIDTNMAGLALDNIAITGIYTGIEPVDPTPTDPDPTDPDPTDPDPTDPDPTDPDPTDPDPTDPDPTDPDPTDPDPTDPTPTDPDPTDPTPTDPEPTDPTPTDPEPTDPTPTDPEPEPTSPGKGGGKGGKKQKDSDADTSTDQTSPSNGNGKKK